MRKQNRSKTLRTEIRNARVFLSNNNYCWIVRYLKYLKCIVENDTRFRFTN